MPRKNIYLSNTWAHRTARHIPIFVSGSGRGTCPWCSWWGSRPEACPGSLRHDTARRGGWGRRVGRGDAHCMCPGPCRGSARSPRSRSGLRAVAFVVRSPSGRSRSSRGSSAGRCLRTWDLAIERKKKICSWRKWWKDEKKGKIMKIYWTDVNGH